MAVTGDFNYVLTLCALDKRDYSLEAIITIIPILYYPIPLCHQKFTLWGYGYEE